MDSVSLSSLVDQAKKAFSERFGGEPEVVTAAPGRVNLIGEHTDYNGGYVFPAAIDRYIVVAGRRSDAPSRLVSLEPGLGEAPAFAAADLHRREVQGWAAYAAGVAWVLQQEGFEGVPDVEAVVASNVPMGSGVSSSAALEMAFGKLYDALGRFQLSNKELALYGQRCENRFVGVNCGVMDQMASAMGVAGSAIFLDTLTLDLEPCPLPHGLDIVLCDTRKSRKLAGSEYNERRAQCEAAAQALGVGLLREANLEMLESAKGTLDPLVYRRAYHVITENARCLEFRSALKAGDTELCGWLLRDSHLTLRDDYEVSCRELNVMAEAANAAPGCIGARMTGAGFGGACVALVQAEALGDFVNKASAEYVKRAGREGAFLVCRAVDGARVVESNL
ncbi:MAG: galactokinase [Fimbriimonadales bacterium]|nr:galactokinase [Fimbriimonadales bacterium]